MVIKCLERNHRYGVPFNLAFHYSICHDDKIGKGVWVDKTLSGICIKTDCSFKGESGYSPSIDSSSNPSSSPNPSSSSSTSPNPSIDPSPNPKVITTCCNRCNYVKPLTNFDKSKYTFRNCTYTNVSCLYCPSIVRYDGMNAHVKRQHPDVDIPKGFTINLRTDEVRGKPSSYTDLNITQNEESCLCKYYNYVSFLINNAINIEKVKENIILLKSIDNFKEIR